MTQDGTAYVTNANHQDDQAGRFEHAHEAAEVEQTAAIQVGCQVAEVGQTSAGLRLYKLMEVAKTSVLARPN